MTLPVWIHCATRDEARGFNYFFGKLEWQATKLQGLKRPIFASVDCKNQRILRPFMNNTLDLIKEYIDRHIDNPPAELTLDSKLDEIGLDSLAMLELMFELEDKYGIHVPNDTLKPETVGQFVELVEKFKPAAVNE